MYQMEKQGYTQKMFYEKHKNKTKKFTQEICHQYVNIDFLFLEYKCHAQLSFAFALFLIPYKY